MLPKSIYQSLPYIYIGLGIFCMMIVESRLILFSSVLLIVTGGLVLLMRRSAADSVEPVNKIDDDSEIVLDASTNSLDSDRRFEGERSFPLIDDKEGLIAFDRRTNKSDKKG
ncbi:MAG: hypothetical protein OEY06_10815 [Gammaproteobacteria bacterium]|nr:hypothetical protein [Gammaproteobacteria bacterium]